MSQLGGRRERVGGGDDDAKGEEGEVENWDVEGRRAEDEGDVVSGEGRVLGLEECRERVNLAEELGVGQLAAGGGVDEEWGGGSGGGGGGGSGVMEEGEGVFNDGNWLRKWW